MELSPTARVILGFLGFEPMSGYEIKSFVDNSTRFFWAASYGQIYPELKRLAEAGLIEGENQAQGERKRVVYSLTDSGREALADWHGGGDPIQETRDETLLKMFFADAIGGEATERALEAKRDHHNAVAEQLRAVERMKRQSGQQRESPMRTLRLGIDWNEWIADWCERELDEVRYARTGTTNGRTD
ncbi:MAG TPA: PadR family transcriptional regulator [Solirubrobacterales bacterium]|nr:PadR family transcriptional regulator [Solirubrobacterales bacterium]